MKRSAGLPMKSVALEFSSPQRSMAAVNSDEGIAHEVVAVGSGATRWDELAEDVLHGAKLERGKIDCIAVGLGPGSYTGIRTAIAWAQGWQLAREVKLLGIGSADCVAAEAHRAGLTGCVDVVIDAQREEFYLATYELSAGSWRERSPLRIVTFAEVRERERTGSVLIGPEATRWFSGGRLVFPRAATLGELA